MRNDNAKWLTRPVTEYSVEEDFEDTKEIEQLARKRHNVPLDEDYLHDD